MMYKNLVDHTKGLLKAFFDLSQAHKGKMMELGFYSIYFISYKISLDWVFCVNMVQDC